MKRLIDVIVNKHFEVEPFMAAMIAMHTHHKLLPMPCAINVPKKGVNRMNVPRAVYELKSIKVNVWCIEDLMSPDVSGSNSKEKSKVLPDYIAKDNPDFVISVSTAESTPKVQCSDKDSLNGSVLIGASFFMFDARQYNPTQPSPSDLNVIEEFQRGNLGSSFYKYINLHLPSVVNHFIQPVNYPAPKMCCDSNPTFVSVGVVNIVEYEGYKKGDPAAYEEAERKFKGSVYIPATIETTHGIVKMSVKRALPNKNVPTIFVSPITDRYKHFEDDVDAGGIQNYIAGYNSGIAVGKLLTLLDSDNQNFNWESNNE